LNHRRAFTLVELLVVIGIIAVLVGILLPVVKSAREQAVSLQCQSNLRSCGQVFYIYATQNKGFLPMMIVDTLEVLPGTVSAANMALQQGLPPAGSVDAPVYPDVRTALARIVNAGKDTNIRPYNPGGLLTFYCPANYLWDADARYNPATPSNRNSHWPEDFLDTARIKYWYFGCPNPWYPRFHYRGTFGPRGESPAGQGGATLGTLDWRFWDLNHSGDNRDEYANKLGDRNMARIPIMCDQSRVIGSANTQAFGLTFIHGKKSSSRITGWKNVLFADGHVEARRARESSFSPDGTQFTNASPGADELQPRWGPGNSPSIW
jgi:prepilin-type N-terminal cleavage/methylation domain-containing protein/prepilin-type processing-associated H-X9-DG protein